MILRTVFSIVILFTSGVDNAEKRDILYHAVTPIDGLERLYLSTKPPLNNWKVREPREAQPETDDERQKVCSTVVTSEHFLDFYRVYPTHFSNDENKTCHPEESSANLSTNGTTYSYEKREVGIEGRNIHELVFPCSARSNDTGEVVKFFISQVYMEKSRFVFKNNDEKKLVLVALAEISPYVTTHLLQSSTSLLPSTAESRFICDIAAPQKVRLCSLIMNNLVYRDKHKVRFIPSRNSEPECEKRSVKVGFISEKEVWAVPCTVVSTSKNRSDCYYIIAGNKYSIVKQKERKYIYQADAGLIK